MSTPLYERRIEQEWQLLRRLAAANPQLLHIKDRKREFDSETFDFALLRTQAIIRSEGRLEIVDSHSASLHFPPYFPAVPIEACLACPVFHPNVNPENGFVCLWNRHSPGDTVMESVAQLQRVLTFQLVNDVSQHVMQPEALDWYRDPKRELRLPLRCEPVCKVEEFQLQRTYAARISNHRRRLY